MSNFNSLNKFQIELYNVIFQKSQKEPSGQFSFHWKDMASYLSEKFEKEISPGDVHGMTIGLKDRGFIKGDFSQQSAIMMRPLAGDPNKSTKHSTQTINVQNADNSIIGTQGTAILNQNITWQQINTEIESNANEDEEDLKYMVSYIQENLENDDPLKKGAFEKFSDLISKHGWISGPISAMILKYLTGI